MKCLCYSRCLLGPKYTLDICVSFKSFGMPWQSTSSFSVQPQSLSQPQRHKSVALLRQHWKAFFGWGEVECMVTYMMLLS